ncbi:rap guanine nucleotide exchange factor-like 1 [Acipenser ruthenus]|uniref:rap guanine nucleotide exchange factor-like 1 n=1 Tax=Acipenser ruthenus TaxID=7906 RepID=UPI00145B08E0|nr:rap guanine nucleotide exchange factor-like 1 [Acipenser ruthenus]
MPAGIKPLEKFLKKQTSALSRAGGFGDKVGSGGPRRRTSVSRVLPFFRDLSPESAQPPREVFSPDAEDTPSWHPGPVSGAPAAASSSSSSRSDSRSPSLSSDEQSALEGSLETPTTATAAWGEAPLAPDTPENLVLALLDSVTASKRQSGSCAEILLDDFMLTHPIFLSADKLQQVLLKEFRADRKSREGCRGFDSADRKQAVLSVAFRYLKMYRHLLQDEGEKSHTFPKELCACVVQDLARYPELVEEVLKLQRWTEILQDQALEESDSKKPVRPLFRHFRRVDACLQPREAFRGSDEIFCRVYTPDHSYVTIRSRLSSSVQEILALVSEKLQYSEEQEGQQGAMVLVAVTSSGEKAVFRPSEDSVFTTLGVNTHLFACEPERLGALVPLPEEIHWSPGDSRLHDMSAEEVANQLLAFDWELFSCVHEVEFVRYVFRGEEARWRPLNLELVLQRCSEVQHWVGTEILQCQSLPKRGQLLRKFIKIAALCKQNQDLLSFLSVVLGLNNPALSRLRQTWEGLPSKFKKQFQQLESISDPSRNHKSYRDLLSSLRPPIIPFTPLLLKDLTFLHESSKTFHGPLVNFEKMHKVAEMVRTIRRYRSSPPNLDTDSTPSYLQTKAFVRQLQVIDNQNLLFNMSYKLEPKDT